MAYLVLVRTETKVLNSLAGILGASDEKGVASRGSPQCQLVEGQDLTTGSQDSGPRSRGEAKSSDAHLGDGQEAVVIGDGANDDDGLAFGLLGGVCHDARDGHRRAVDSRHEEAAEDDLVEVGIGSPCAMNQMGHPANNLNQIYVRARKR